MDRSFLTGFLKHSSFEVALGAVLMSAAMAATYEVHIPISVYLALFNAVWFIYLLDRLFDAKKIKFPASNPRHLFYQQHHSPLSILLILTGIAGLSTIPFLPPAILTYGMMLMGVCLLYLLGVFLTERKLPKEVLIAVLYTTGVLLAPALLYAGPLDEHLVIFPVIFFIALTNLLLFSRAEAPYDKKDGQASMVLGWSTVKLNGALNVTLALAGILILALGFCSDTPRHLGLPLVLLMMTAILWVLHLRIDQFKNQTLFRCIGDGVFLLPALLVFP